MKYSFFVLAVLFLGVLEAFAETLPPSENIERFYSSPLVQKLTIHQNLEEFDSYSNKEKLKLLDKNLELIRNAKKEMSESQRVALDGCCTYGYRIRAAAMGFVLAVFSLGSKGHLSKELTKEFRSQLEFEKYRVGIEKQMLDEFYEPTAKALEDPSNSKELKNLLKETASMKTRIEHFEKFGPSRWSALKNVLLESPRGMYILSIAGTVAAALSVESFRRAITGYNEVIEVTEIEKQQLEQFLDEAETELLNFKKDLGAEEGTEEHENTI